MPSSSRSLPRLVALPWLAKAPTDDQAAPGPIPTIDDQAVQKTVALSLEANGQSVAVYVSELRRSGVGAESRSTGTCSHPLPGASASCGRTTSAASPT